MTDQTNPTRQALLTAAESLFSQRGFFAVGIREIAQQAGVNLSAIKYHFGSKHDLYLETVRRAMEHHGDEPMDMLADPPDDPEAAVALLVRFIYGFFGQLRETREIDTCGLLMIREALQPSEAHDAVVLDYLHPVVDSLLAVLRVIRPDLDAAGLFRHATSLMGQLIHYKVFRSFIEALRDVRMTDRKIAAESAEHVAMFTLRGLGCDEMLINRAMIHAEADAEALREGRQT